jgi:hypothetical protein
MIIKDPNQIKYRAALQIERDYQAQDLGLVAEDLRQKYQTGLSQGKELLTEADVKNFQKILADIANSHLELQFQDDWKKQPLQFRTNILNQATRELFSLIKTSKENISDEVEFYAPPLLEKFFVESLKTTQRNKPPTGL